MYPDYSFTSLHLPPLWIHFSFCLSLENNELLRDTAKHDNIQHTKMEHKQSMNMTTQQEEESQQQAQESETHSFSQLGVS